MSEVVNLGAARASKTHDCRNWTVVEALRDALAEAESGRLNASMVYIAFQTKEADGSSGYGYVAAGASNLEIQGLLAQHLHFRGR